MTDAKQLVTQNLTPSMANMITHQPAQLPGPGDIEEMRITACRRVVEMQGIDDQQKQTIAAV